MLSEYFHLNAPNPQHTAIYRQLNSDNYFIPYWTLAEQADRSHHHFSL
jgi:hypothetical protein